MFKKLLQAIISFTLLTGCMVAFAAEPDLSETRLKEVRTISLSMLIGSLSDNNKAFVSSLAPQIKSLLGDKQDPHAKANREELGQLQSLTQESVKQEPYGTTFIYKAKFSKQKEPIKYLINIDDKNTVHDFWLFWHSTKEQAEVNKVAEESFKLLYGNKYDDFIKCFVKSDRKFITKARFTELRDHTVKAYGSFKSIMPLEQKDYEMKIPGFEIPFRPVYASYNVDYEKKVLPFIFIPNPDENEEIKIGGFSVVGGFDNFAKLDYLAKISLGIEKNPADLKLSPQVTAPVSVAYQAKIDGIAEKVFSAFFNTQDFIVICKFFDKNGQIKPDEEMMKSLHDHPLLGIANRKYVEKRSLGRLAGDKNVFLYNVIMDDQMVYNFKLLFNNDQDNPKLLGYNISLPIRHVGNIKDL